MGVIIQRRAEQADGHVHIPGGLIDNRGIFRGNNPDIKGPGKADAVRRRSDMLRGRGEIRRIGRIVRRDFRNQKGGAIHRDAGGARAGNRNLLGVPV